MEEKIMVEKAFFGEEGQHIYYDSMQEIGMKYDEEKAGNLCASMKEVALLSRKTEDEKAEIQDMTIAKLEDMGLLCMVGRDYAPTHGFNLMTDNTFKYSKIQCALFKCRNAAISEAFYYMGIIEAWGTGLGRIRKSCKEYGLKEPVIEEFGNGFRVIIYKNVMPDVKGGTESNTETTKNSTEMGWIRKIMMKLQQNGIIHHEGSI